MYFWPLKLQKRLKHIENKGIKLYSGILGILDGHQQLLRRLVFSLMPRSALDMLKTVLSCCYNYIC